MPLAFRPHLEMLEDRVVLSVLTVNTTADSTAPSNNLTLREAILLVDNGGNAQAALGRNLTAGEAGQISGAFGFNDTIRFDDDLKSQTITLNGSALPDISQNVTITGLGASNSAISGNNQSGIFTIDAGTQVNISGLAIEDGNAGNGGGINNSGTLTVSNSSFSGDSTNGGDIYNGGTLAVKVTVHGSNSMKSRGFCKAEGRFEPQNAHLRSRTP
jgi:CSLREA domain-containing protein